MRQHCEIETAGAAVPSWPGEMVEPRGDTESIDLDRVVWDPEYRDQVLELFRSKS